MPEGFAFCRAFFPPDSPISLLFFEWDNVGGVSRFGYTDGAPPSAGGSFAAQDLITGTGFVYGVA